MRVDEVRGVLARASQRQLVIVGGAVVAPGVVVVDGVAMVVAVGAVGGIAGIAPDERDRGAVDSEQRDAGLGHERLQVLARAEAVARSELHAGAPHAGGGEDRLQARSVGALGQPEPSVPAGRPAAGRPVLESLTVPLEAVQVRGDPRLHLQARTDVGREQRQHGVGRRGRPAQMRRERPQQVSPTRGHAPRSVLVVGAPGALQLGGEAIVATGTQPGGVLAVGEAAGVVDEGVEALGETRARPADRTGPA